MEHDVVLPHELDQFNVELFASFPPFLVIVTQEVFSDGNIANGCIKPYIKHLVLELLQRYGNSPLKIPRHAPIFEIVLQPKLSLTLGIV